MPPFLPLPADGRVFTTEYLVRLGDATPGRRARFDALARYLQDVAEDDATDAGWPTSIGWVLRRALVTVPRFPALGERLRLQTFCSASASRWAERTTTITGDAGGLVQARATWVAMDITTGRPVHVGEFFEQVYGPSTGGHRASARLHLRPPPPEVIARARPWPFRAGDFDVWHHVNNVISWAAVEDELGSCDWLPANAEVEYNEAIAIGACPSLASRCSQTSMDLWLLEGDRVLTSARLNRFETGQGTASDKERD
jgi:acyl-ACP thioesterase